MTKGSYTISETVTDSGTPPGSASARTIVTVSAQPVIIFGSCNPATAGKPTNCSFSASGGTGPYSFTWSAPGGNPSSGSASNFVTTYPIKGIHNIAADVADANGRTASVNVGVSVAQQPFVASVMCGPSTGAPITAGKPFSCIVSATGGTSPYQGTGDISLVLPVKGTFHESFNVNDANGKTAVASTVVNVVPQPLVVTVTCPTSGVTAGKPFNCDVSASGGTAPYSGTGSGLLGQYWQDTFFGDTLAPYAGCTAYSLPVNPSSAPTATTIDPNISFGASTGFNWRPVIPPSFTGVNHEFSVKWDGTITIATAGSYGFQLTSDDGSWLYIDGALVINDGGVHAPGAASTTLSLAAGPHSITVDFYETCDVQSGIDLSWMPPGSGSFSLVPSSVLSSGSGVGSFTITEPVKGTYSEVFVVRDSNGAVAKASADVIVVPQPLTVTVTCSSAPTAGKPFNCKVSATGGTAPYSGTGTFTVTQPVKGTFTESFTVGDANGKSAVASTQVTVIQQPFLVTVSCGSTASAITAGKPFSCTVSASGGTSPYKGTGTFQVTQPVKGTFTESFNVTDANGKSAVASTQVTVVQQPFAVSIVCGTAGTPITAGKPFPCTVTATGGTAPYSGIGTFHVTIGEKGAFSVNKNVTDANGKTQDAITEVTVVQQPFVATVNCGTATGSITAGKPFTCTVTATGGTAPYQGVGQFTVTQPVKGIFTESFNVKDANGKSTVASTQVTVVQQPFIVSVTCGTTTGGAITAGKPFNCTVTASGGTSPYTGTGTFTVTQPVKGTFSESFSITDANGKSAVATTQVTVIQQPFIVTVACGSSTGAITAGKPFACTVSATGGTAPYTGIGTFTVTEPVKGTFTESFNVKDANGKSAVASTQVTVIQQPFVVSVACGTSTGAITAGKPFNCTVSATGGTAPYNGIGTFTITEPTKGTFTESFTVKDANGKSAVATTQVTVVQQPFLVSIVCGSTGTPITAGKPFTCTVSASGGTAPYQGIGSFTVTFGEKGIFSVNKNVTDANAKSADAVTHVTVVQQPFVATVTCGSATAAITAGKPFSCTVSATGGTAPYQGIGTFQITEPVKGTFTESFTVKDANGKSAVATTQVTVVQQPFIVSVTCGSPTTSITAGKPFACTVSATGGTTPYTGTGTFQVTEPIKGTFRESFNVADANGKTALATTTVTVVPQPLLVTVTCPGSGVTAGKPFNCTVSATGGTAPYTGTGTGLLGQYWQDTFFGNTLAPYAGCTAYSLPPSPSSAPTATQVDPNINFGAPTGFNWRPVIPPSFTGVNHEFSVKWDGTITIATAGSYGFQLTSDDGSWLYIDGALVINDGGVHAPGAASTTLSLAAGPHRITVDFYETCDVQSGIDLSWLPPGAGSYTIVPSSVLSSGTGVGSFTITEPVKGTFSEVFVVRDANGAVAKASATVTVLQQPFVATVICGGAAPHTAGKPFSCVVSATGGTAPYQGTGTFQVTEPVKGIFRETFTVTDANGKSAVAADVVQIFQQPFVVTVSCGSPTAAITAGKPFSCTVSASGGTAPYKGTGTFQVTQPVKGTFTESFNVTDANGKSAVASTQVTVVQQPFLVGISCGSGTPITAGKPFTCTVSASGGTAPYSGIGSFTVTFGSKGTFSVNKNVTDANGKSFDVVTSVIVVQQPFVASVTCGTAAGTPITAGKPFNCTVSATGGTSPYQGTGTFGQLIPAKGTYSKVFSVTDANGKSASATATVTVIQQPFITTVTCGTSSGSPITAGKPFDCTVSATGGTAPYQGTGSFTVTEPVKGTFTESFRVSDANGKSVVASTQVTVTQQPFIVTVTCGSTPAITAGKPFTCNVSATGGTAPYQGIGSFTVTEPMKGTFTESFKVKDANGKSAVASTQVTVIQQPFVVTVTCGSSTTALTAGKPFSCDVTATGGTTPYSGVGSFTVTQPVKGTFTESFKVTDANGKSATASTQVTIVQQPFTVTAFCGASGTPITAGKPFSCTVSATGGTGPYTGTGTFTITQPVKGTFTESFTVGDANGKSVVASTQVTVIQQPFTVAVTCGTANSAITAGKPFSCTVTATGGTTPYQGTGTFQVTQPVKGTFTESFNVKDANGKIAVATTQVTVVQQPFVVSVTCGAGTTITAGKPFSCTVTASGGTAPYQGAGTFQVTQPVKGTFTETFNVKDANGKTAVATTQVTVAQQPFVASVVCGSPGIPNTAGKPITCVVSATGGTAPYTGIGVFHVTFAEKGTFSIDKKVTDSNGKSTIAVTDVTVVQQPFIASVTCGSSGTPITAGKPFTCIVSATGGTIPYTGTGSFTVTQPVKGTFQESFIVTDANGKSITGTAQVTVLQQPFVVSVTCASPAPITAGKPFSCTVSATGGTSPYRGTGTFQVTEPVKGTFTERFTVTDANGKSAVATAQVTVVQQPFVVSVTCGAAGTPITAGKPFSCTVSATGGTGPYQGTGTFQVTQPVKGTFTESFNVKDANGKTAVASTQVTVVQQPFVVSVTCGSAGTPITAGKPFDCTVSATGGTAPYQGTGTFSQNIPAKGTYSKDFTVTDANGKHAIATATVTVVQQPFTVSVTCGTAPSQVTAGKPFSCSVSATGGTTPYQGTGTFQVTEPVKGTFTEKFTVTDANGKSAVASTQVAVVQQPFIVSVTCGSSTTAITAGKPFTCTVSAVGGTAPYSGAGKFQVTEPTKGTFTERFTLTDANGKTAVATVAVTVLQQPFIVAASCQSTAPITAGKPFSCTVSATGGTAPYQGTGTFQVTQPVKGTFTESFNVKDANGKTAVASTQVTVLQQPFVVSVTCGASGTSITAGKPFNCIVSATGGTSPYTGTGTFTETQPTKGTFTESFTITDGNGKSAVASTSVTVVQQPFVVSANCGSSTATITAGKPFSCDVSATGGTAPYQGTGTFQITEPAKGSFTERFTVTDANGKTAVASTQVTVVQQPFVVSVTCGSSTASITAGKPFSCTVSAIGGTGPYQGTGTFQVTQPTKGTFTESFNVKDANGKTAVASTQVTVVQQPFVVSVTCGSAGTPITAGKPFDCTVSATGGTSPYQGTGTSSHTLPTKGTYSTDFTVTDANGKHATATATVTVVQQPFTVSVTCGTATSQVTAGKPFSCDVSATGGTAPYHGTGTFQVTEPVKGTFTERFTVTDANGKSAVASTQVTVVQQPFIVSVTCGSSTTSITAGKPFSCVVSATGGTGPYQGTGTFQVTQPVKGTFTESFTVSDANGKSAVASTQVTVVQQPFVVSVTCGTAGTPITAGKPFSCVVSAIGGTGPYHGTGTFQVTQPVKGTFTESFTVTDANGKTANASTHVSVLQQPFIVTVACGSTTAAITAGKPFDCNVSATGGTGPYHGTGTFQVTEPVKGTFAESFTVTDANGKSATASTQVTVVQQPFIVNVTCGTSTAAITAGKPFTCTVSATGGTSPYQGVGQFTVTEPVKGTFTESFNVKDANGKAAVASTQVIVVQQPFVVAVTCGSTAPITAGKPFDCTVSASGGTSPYGGTGTFRVTQPMKGTFTERFTVTDANGKSAVASTQVIVVQQPFVVSVTCGSTTATITAGKPFTCDVSATGGTAPYQGTGSFTETQPIKGTFTESFNVKDANGKTAVASTQVTVLQQPFVVSVTCGTTTSAITAGKPFSCNVSATGGTAPYHGTGTFQVTEPVKGTFAESFTVTDSNGKSAVASVQVTVLQQPFVATATCGASGTPITAGKPFTCTVSATGGTAPYQGTGTFTETQPVKGTFTESFTVSDANGKSAVASAQVTVVQQPFVVSVTCASPAPITAGKPFSCTVSATGGTGPYQGTGTFQVTQPAKGTFTESFNVKDANGKTTVATTQVSVVQQPFTVSLVCGAAGTPITAGKPFTCTASASGGTAPYTGTGSFTVTFGSKGTFSVNKNVTDANGKSADAVTHVTVVQQPFVASVTCGTATSTITAGKPFNCTVSATGGTAPYQGTGSFTETQPVKGTFTESFTVTDANGKSSVASTQVTVVQQPFVTSVTCGSTAPITAGKPFSCTVSATGGTAPYHGTGTFTETQPVKGTFTESFTVTDSNGKSTTASTQVTVVQQPFIVSVTCGSSTSTITAGKPFNCTVTATGGTAPYQGTGMFTETQPVKGTFTESFTVTDANGKSAVASTQVTVLSKPITITASCSGASGDKPIGATAGKPISCNATGSGGTPGYTFSWSAAAGSPSAGSGASFMTVFAVKGTYTITVTASDANGNKASVNITVNVAPQPLVPSFTSQCIGSQSVQFTATVSGGTSPYKFSWSFGDSSSGSGNPVTHAYTSSGPFTVTLTVTDANGARATATSKVTTCGDILTDSSLCPLPNNQFTLIYITDPHNPGVYRLVASNPGQFYDNVFNAGTPGTPVSLTITVPYPFITQGAYPIQVSSGFNVVNGCFQPAFDQNGNFAISTTGGHLSSSGQPVILLSDYSPQNQGATTTVHVTGTVPATGLVYVTIHLAYGLKKTTGWTEGGSGQATNAAGFGNGSVTINNPQTYGFSFTNGSSSSTSPTSVNMFKKDPGFAGTVTYGTTENPIAGATVKIYDNNGNLLGITTTDQNGVYVFQFKYTGPSTTFTVKVISNGVVQSQAVAMLSNVLVQAYFVY